MIIRYHLDPLELLKLWVRRMMLKLGQPPRGPELTNPVENARDGTGKQGIEKLT